VAYCTLTPAKVRFATEALFLVEAYEQGEVKPRVSSQVVWLDPRLYRYGRIKKGEVVARLDTKDFELDLIAAKAELARAKAELAAEKKRSERAKKELALLQKPLSNEEREFLLRIPFLRAAKEAVKAAEAKIERIRLDIERCRVRAPFDLWVVELKSGVGDLASPSKGLFVAMRADKVAARVQIDPKLAGLLGEGAILRYGDFVARHIGSSAWVDPKSKDRYERFVFEKGSPPVGDYLAGRLEGREVEGIVAVPRSALALDGSVWVVNEGRLKKLRLECPWEDGQRRYCKADAPLALVLRPSDYFFEGMKVRGVERCE
jgi:hypothetical protein